VRETGSLRPIGTSDLALLDSARALARDAAASKEIFARYRQRQTPRMHT